MRPRCTTGSPAREELRDRPELGSRRRVVEHDVGHADDVELLDDARASQTLLGRVDADDEDGAGGARGRVLPHRETQVDRADGVDSVVGQRLVEAAAREGPGLHDHVLLGADQDEIAVEDLVKARRALEERLLEAELHEDQDHREGDAGDRHQQSQLLAGQLQPGERFQARIAALRVR